MKTEGWLELPKPALTKLLMSDQVMCCDMPGGRGLYRDVPGRYGFDRFSSACAQYIEENAQLCVKTEGWLELPKPALTKLLMSDQVEYNVQRKVISSLRKGVGHASFFCVSLWYDSRKT